jgi:predicted metal-dependent peptidase
MTAAECIMHATTRNANDKDLKAMKACRLTDKPIPKDLQERCRTKIIKARVRMLFHQPFFGTLITRLEVLSADSWLPTMAVDGRRLYFNHAFVDALEPEELVFVFAHEILHMCYGHLDRCGDRQRGLYNCAADYVVNDELIQVNVGKFPTTVPGLHDVKYRGWSSEEVYDDLYKQQQKKGGVGSLDDLLDKLLDEHLDGSEGGGKEGGDEKDGKGSCNGPVKLSEEERKQIKADMKQQIISASQLSQPGQLPAGVQRLINDWTDPKMDWRTLLETSLTSLIHADYSFLKINRKTMDLDAVLPGMIDDPLLNIDVAIDMSGSIGQEEANIFLSEVKGIMDQYPNFEINVFCFDTECYGDEQFTSDNGHDISTYEVRGGGGTDGSAIFRHLKDQNRVPLKLVVFTDGYVGDFGDENYCPTVWIIKGSDVVPPFGQHAYYDEEKHK